MTRCISILILTLGTGSALAQADDGPWQLLPSDRSSVESGKVLTHAEGGWVVLKGLDTEVVHLEGVIHQSDLSAFQLQVGTLHGRGKLETGGIVPSIAIDGIEIMSQIGGERTEAVLTDAAVDAGPIHDTRFAIDTLDTTWSTFAVGPAATTASWGILIKTPIHTEGTKHTPIPVAVHLRVKVQAQGYGDVKPDVRLRFLATGHADPMGQLKGSRIDAGMQGSIHRAIDAGVDSLLAEQEIDGSWSTHQPQYPAGGTALVVYTLLKCGIAKDHQAIQRGVQFLQHHKSNKTYGVSTTILALVALDDPAHESWLEDHVEFLLDNQQGGWAYPGGARDMSCTQYAVLALRAAANHGIRVSPKVWQDVADFSLDHMEEADAYTGAGFSYRMDGAPNPTGSMTSSGVGVLAICQEQLGKRFKSTYGNARKSGVLWLAEYFDPRGNPYPRQEKPDTWLVSWRYYYYYGLERVGSLLELERFGPNDWYRQGAAALLLNQNAPGNWNDTQHDTAFALLFLSRATGASSGPGQSNGRTYGEDDLTKDVSLRASGGAPLNVWVTSFGTDALGRYEHEGEIGDGPRVVQVEYLAGREGRTLEPIGLSRGNADAPSKRGRFALRHRFQVAGAYSVKAWVTVVNPANGEHVVLESEPLLIRVPEAYHAELADYADDPSLNQIKPALTKVEASSQQSGRTASFTIDNAHTTMWISGNEDPLPRISFEFKKPVKANALVLSHAFSARDLASQESAKPSVIEVRFNGKNEAFRIELDDDIYKKTLHRFEKNLTLKSMEIQVVELRKGSPPDQGVGFAEIELRKLPKK